MAELDDFVTWALRADLPSSRQIGRHAVGRVLVALCTYADGTTLEAFPAAQKLADDVSGLTRRDVRNALAVLESAGLIARTGERRGRANVLHLAGYPADAAVSSDPAGYPATPDQGQTAGKVAGEVAGPLAGYPAPNRTELNIPPSPRVLDALAAHGVTKPADVERVVALARADPETASPAGRIAKSPVYAARLAAQVLGERARERREAYDRAPRCDTCSRPQAQCLAAQRRISPEDKHRFTIRAVKAS